MKPVLRPFLLILAVVCLCCSAFADGKVFTHAVAVPAKTPDQRAMLHFDHGVERLVIETSFVAEGTNFAWVVPFPSPPKIEAVPESFFPDLNSAFQPKLIHRPSRLWIFYSFLGGVISLTLSWHRKGKTGRAVIWLLLIIGSGVVVILLPSFVLARGHGSIITADTVKVLQRQSVGIYDTVVLSSKDGGTLLDWLNTHQFSTPTNALSVISSYAAQGWVFAAATLQRTNTASLQTKPHPLSFTFATKKAVYPLRLTGIDNDQCAIELFVFGPDRAEADRFKVEYCGRPHVSESESFNDWANKMGFNVSFPGEYRITDPVSKMTSPSAVTTKLVGTLSPREMQSDAYVNWVPFEAALPTLYSYGVARDVGLDWFFFLFVSGGLLIQLFATRMTGAKIKQTLIWTGLVAAFAGLMQYAVLPKTEVRTVHDFNAAINNLRQLDGALDQMNIERHGQAPLPFAAFKADLDQYIRGGVKNPLTYTPLLEEKTPGNITLETNGNGIDVIWYDMNGSPHPIANFETRTQ